MKNDLNLKVVSRDGVLFDGKAETISSINEKGKFDILAQHANFISLIKEYIKINANGSDKEIKISVSNQKEAFDGNITDDIWREILIKTRSKSTSTEALLRASKPLTFNGETLTLGVFYSFHKERLEEPFHKRILED